MAATYPEAAKAATDRFGLPDVGEIETLLAMPRLDLVYIATPPFLHFSQAMQALRAGKHVLVEKPTALLPAETDEMVAADAESFRGKRRVSFARARTSRDFYLKGRIPAEFLVSTGFNMAG